MYDPDESFRDWPSTSALWVISMTVSGVVVGLCWAHWDFDWYARQFVLRHPGEHVSGLAWLAAMGVGLFGGGLGGLLAGTLIAALLNVSQAGDSRRRRREARIDWLPRFCAQLCSAIGILAGLVIALGQFRRSVGEFAGLGVVPSMVASCAIGIFVGMVAGGVVAAFVRRCLRSSEETDNF